MEESRGALLFQKVCHILNIILKVAVMVIIAFPFLLDGQHVIKGLYRGAAVPAYPIPIQSSLGKLRSCI